MIDEEYEKILSECAYKSLPEMTKEEVEVIGREGFYCQNSFVRFLRWVKIIEPPIPGQTAGGVIDFDILPHIGKFIKSLLHDTLISVLKARQVYVSTTLSAYHLWYSWAKTGANLLLFSKGQPESKELLGKSYRIYEMLPPFMKIKIDPMSTEELGLPDMKSSVKAFPSTQSAGISYTASVVTCDEHAAHPYADENYISTKPTRDRGGQFVSVFTADPYSNDNLASAIFTDALSGRCVDCGIDYSWEEREKHEGHKIIHKNDFVPLFFPWSVIPGRTQAWYDTVRKNIPERELAKLSPDLYMSKNYPSTIEEALGLATTVSVFDKKVLNVMMDDVRGQINIGWADMDNEIIHVYKDYHIGNFYVAGTDVSLGVGKDYNITVILDVKTGDIVADIVSQSLSPEQLAFHSIKLLEHYHSPLWWIEENLWGRTVIKKAQELGYRRLGFRDEKQTKAGLVTDEKMRADIFGALIPAINDHQIRIYNQVGLRQFYTMIRNANKNGKIEANSGYHDDYVIATGICWLKKGDVKTNVEVSKPIQTLTFRPRDLSYIRR